jgi:L-2-hydroxyglutarate oxidase LhgO
MLIVIIGAGIVGLHVARAFHDQGHEVFVLDKEPFLGEHTSSRNSGVIHSGIFYQTGSFKERVCIEGNRLTYEWLDQLKVPYFSCGKWVVPEEGQEDQLELFFEKICKLPIPSPELKSADQISQEEPNLRSTRGIFIPSTGILDAASYVKALATYLENQGVTIVLNCEVLEVSERFLKTTRGDIAFDLAVNSAGLFSDSLAKMAGLEGYEIRPCRGDYYILNKNLIRRPVYHLPYKGAQGLGVHLTPTVDGQVLLGPNAFFIDKKEDYHLKSDPESFQRSLAFYLPSCTNGHLSPAYSGNRPKLFFQGKQLTEFTIIKKENWIHLLGIESPGLTAAPALANYAVGLI